MMHIDSVVLEPTLPLIGVLAVPPAAQSIVLISHGFSSSKDGDTARVLQDRLTAAGLATLRYDFFGHGESGGELGDVTLSRAVANLETVLEYVRDRNFAHVGLFGASFGGMVTTLVAARHPELFAVVLKSPVTDYEGKERERWGVDGMARWQREGIIDRGKPGQSGLFLKYAFFEDATHYDGYAEAARVQAPVRIIHGTDDDVVPLAQSQQAVAVMPQAELVALPGVTHDYDKPAQFAQMIDLTVEWFERYRPGSAM